MIDDKILLWSSDDLCAATGGELIGASWVTDQIVMDSRDVKSGNIFIAINGVQLEGRLRTSGQDGHDFVQCAVDNGATAIIVERKMNVTIPQLIVKDTFKALQDIANTARNRATNLTSIAITGSVGKTTIRDMISTALSATSNHVYASQKSYNNALGVPFTLANMPRDTQYGVFEIGMNQSGEIKPLSQMVKPDIALITWISSQHIENFDNHMNGIIDAKCEIFAGMDATKSIAILPRDNDHYDALFNCASGDGIKNINSFGEGDTADSQLIEYTLCATGSDVTANIMGQEISYHLNMPGKHMVMNSLTALLVTKLMNENLHKAADKLGTLTPMAGRGAQHEIVIKAEEFPLILIDDAYNAAAVAMQAAIDVLAMSQPTGNGRRLAFLGNMAELGDDARATHEGLAQYLTNANVDRLYCCGADMKYLYDVIPDGMRGGHYELSTDFQPLVQDIVQPGDVVLVKGSNGSNMKIIVEDIKKMNRAADDQAA